MPLKAVTSDLAGNIYALDDAGRVLLNRRAAVDPARLEFGDPGPGIGRQWLGARLLFAPEPGGGPFGLTTLGELLRPTRVAEQWQPIRPIEPASVPLGGPNVLPDVRHAFTGPASTVYYVTGTGALWRHGYEGGTPGDNARLVDGDGFRGLTWVFTTGEGLFFGVRTDGVLLFRRANAADGTESGFLGDWQAISTGWNRYEAVLCGGPRGIYTVSIEGLVVLHRFDVDAEGPPRLTGRRNAVHAERYSLDAPPTSLVQGYCWPTSVAAGDSVEFMVGVPDDGDPDNPDAVNYGVTIERLRRILDIHGKPVEVSIDTGYHVTKLPQPLSQGHAPGRGWLSDEQGAGWRASFRVSIPDTWASGIYAANCDAKGHHYIPFVVRTCMARSKLAVLVNTNTWNAYNNWGGYSKYAGLPSGDTDPRRPSALPFKRPNPRLFPDEVNDSAHAGTGPHLLRGELWLLGWLEVLARSSDDYRVDCYTDRDLHDGFDGIRDGPAHGGYRALILNTHPEYWTPQMCVNVLRYQQLGGNVLYLGGNGAYEEVGFSDGGAVMRIHPHAVDLARDHEVVRLEDLLRKHQLPERRMLGVGFERDAYTDHDDRPFQIVLDDGPGPEQPLRQALLKGVPTGKVVGEDGMCGKASGWEVDRTDLLDRQDSLGPLPDLPSPPNTPANVLLVAVTSPMTPKMGAQMVCFRTPADGFVFSAGSLTFHGCLVKDTTLRTLVKNALDLCLTGLPPA